MKLPTIHTSLEGSSTNEAGCFKILDEDGVDVTEDLHIKSFSLSLSAMDRRPGVEITAVAYDLPKDMTERLGLSAKSQVWESHERAMWKFTFRAYIVAVALDLA